MAATYGLGSAHHQIHLPGATPGAHKPIAPVGYGRLGAVTLGHFHRVWLDPTVRIEDR